MPVKGKVAEAAVLLASHKEVQVRTNATDARQGFFKLLEQVAADPSAVVVIEHKHAGTGALVGAGFLEYVRALEGLARDLVGEMAEPFRLIGTAVGSADFESALADLRAEQNARAQSRLDAL